MTRKNRIEYLGLAFIFIIFIGATTGGIVLHESNRAIKTALVQKKQQLASLKRKIQSIQSSGLENGPTSTPLENKYVLDFKPDREHQAAFRGELELLAKENNLKIVKFELKSPAFAVKDNPKYQITQWQLTISGDYQGITGFMGALPQEKRLVMIAGLKTASDYLKNNKYRLRTLVTLDLISNADLPVQKL